MKKKSGPGGEKKDRVSGRSGSTASSLLRQLPQVERVLGFPEIKAESAQRKEREVRTLLEGSNGLLYVDNLETVDDARIITFIDALPIGTSAVLTGCFRSRHQHW